MCFRKKKKNEQPEQHVEIVEPVEAKSVHTKTEAEVERKVRIDLTIPENMYKDLKMWASVEYRTLEEQIENILAICLYKHDNDPLFSREPNRYQNHLKSECKKNNKPAEITDKN